MTRPDRIGPLEAVLTLVAVVLVTIAIGCARASAYNAATGASITWWQALVLDPKLREGGR